MTKQPQLPPTIDMDHFMSRLQFTMEADVIRSLLSGNDTQCFTTRQYVHMRDKWIEQHLGDSRESLGLGPIDDSDVLMARGQLLSVPQLISEVGDNVWSSPAPTP